jgi:hypothetical protein
MSQLKILRYRPRRTLHPSGGGLELISLLWIWAGAGFFKWRHDTAGGWFKNLARKEVLKGSGGFFNGAIKGASALVDFGKTYLTTPTATVPGASAPDHVHQRYKHRVWENHFELVIAADLDAVDYIAADERDAVAGTLQVHAQFADGREGVCQFKNVLCRCTRCKESEDHECEQPGYADLEWRIKEIRPAPASIGPRRSARGEASSAAGGTSDQLNAPDEMEPSSWRELAVDLEGKENVAIAYYYSDDLDYYLVQLADDPWHVVPKGEVRDADAATCTATPCANRLLSPLHIADFAMSGSIRQGRRVPRVS